MPLRGWSKGEPTSSPDQPAASSPAPEGRWSSVRGHLGLGAPRQAPLAGQAVEGAAQSERGRGEDHRTVAEELVAEHARHGRAAPPAAGAGAGRCPPSSQTTSAGRPPRRGRRRPACAARCRGSRPVRRPCASPAPSGSSLSRSAGPRAVMQAHAESRTRASVSPSPPGELVEAPGRARRSRALRSSPASMSRSARSARSTCRPGAPRGDPWSPTARRSPPR